ncbi:MAG: hypothetical protein IKX47_07500 [Oscillospiraceae bacterium]|nr:hypothetical protein [Oscillospiraceae bacterium]
MNKDRALVLYDAVTAVREEYIEEAAAPCRKARHWGAWAVAAACLFLLIGGWSFLQPLGFAIANPFLGYFAGRGDGTGSGGSSQDETAYHYYAGPVLPLTAEETELTAERSVEYDFSLYDVSLRDDGRYAYLRSRQACLVTDSYMLTAGEPGTYTLYYPFAATLADDTVLIPSVTVNGEAVKAELLAGPGGDAIFSWEEMKALMGDDYLDRSLEALPRLEERVTVYALSDFRGQESKTAKNPTVEFAYVLDPARTAVTTWGYNGGSNDLQGGKGTRQVGIRDTRGSAVYLLVLGEDLTDWSIRGYADGACETLLESVGATVTRYESTLGEMLALFWKNYREDYLADKLQVLLDKDTLMGLSCQVLLERSSNLLAAVRTLPFGLEDVFDQVLHRSRVLYLRFTVVIPAGEAADIRVSLVKYPSYDHTSRGRERRGFDLAGKLGSNIAFTRLEASVTGAEYIVVYRQDFGFETANGVLKMTRVALDPNGEHWYMDVGTAAKK